MRTRQFTFGREFRQDTTSLRDPGTRKKNKTNAIKGVVKSGWINTRTFPFWSRFKRGAKSGTEISV